MIMLTLKGNFSQRCTDVHALLKIQPQNLNRWKVHSLFYLRSTSNQFYACARPQKEHVINVHSVQKIKNIKITKQKQKNLLILGTGDIDRLHESLN